MPEKKATVNSKPGNLWLQLFGCTLQSLIWIYLIKCYFWEVVENLVVHGMLERKFIKKKIENHFLKIWNMLKVKNVYILSLAKISKCLGYIIMLNMAAFS